MGVGNPTLSSSVQNDPWMVDENVPDFDMEWDAGEIGCGDLILELRIRMNSLKPGQILKVLASDKGAQQDLPAWCRMTGNTLVQFGHPAYFIKRKTD